MLDTGLRELTEALRDGAHLTADEICDRLPARFGADTEDDVVLAVVRREPV